MSQATRRTPARRAATRPVKRPLGKRASRSIKATPTTHPLRDRLRDIGISLIGAVVIVTLISRFLLTPFRVEQSSMAPTLESGEHLIVDRVTPLFDELSRGDIVVFTPPESWGMSDATPYVKRIIGLPGDTIVIDNGDVFRNGDLLVETYLAPGTTTAARWDVRSFTVPEGQIFVMGDHRLVSDDSRGRGTIPISAVIGRVAIRYLPLDRATLITAP